MVLRRVFGSESEEVAGEDCVMRSFTTFMHLSMLLGWSNQEGWDGRSK